MRAFFNRKTAPKILKGRTAGKNRRAPTSHQGYVIDRESPGRGYRHVLTKQDLLTFIELIPDWGELSYRLERITLAEGTGDEDGCHEFYDREETGAIALHAWEEDLWMPLELEYFCEHRLIFERLGVGHEAGAGQEVVVRFSPAQARAFVLLHVFLHELGHHWDCIHQKHRHGSQGESYAESFANGRFEEIYPRYVAAFGDPRRG